MRRSALCVVLGIIMPPLIGAFSAPANATAVTVGTNYQETSIRKGTSVPTVSSCSNSVLCYVIFNIIPSGKQLLVTDVSCAIQLVGGKGDNFFRATLATFTATSDSTDRGTFLSPTKTLSATRVHYTLNGATRHPYRAGERPVVSLRTDQADFFDPICTIMGKVGNPPE